MKLEKIQEIVKIKQEVIDTKHKRFTIKSPECVVELIREEIGFDDREVFLLLCLNNKNVVISIYRCHIGSINASIVHPREVFKAAILSNAAFIIVAHNHPNLFCAEASSDDKLMTTRLKNAGEIIGISLLDHIIVSGDTHKSLRELGYV